MNNQNLQAVKQAAFERGFQKQAILVTGGLGALLGALNSPENLKGEGALRGAGIGVGTGLGAGLGSMAGFLGGGALGGALFGGEGGLRDMSENNARKFMLTVLLGQVLGMGAGGYGGYRLGKNTLWFDDEQKAKAKKEYAKSKDKRILSKKKKK